MCILSIITPHYNMSSSSARAINSVPLDTNKYIEHLILDDCSDDYEYQKMSEIIVNSNRNNIKIYKNKKNVGPIQTINSGAKKAKGKYLLFLSADDWLEQKFISDIVLRILYQKSNGIVIGDLCVSYNDDARRIKLKSFRKVSEIEISAPAENILDGLVTVLHGQAIIRRDLFLNYGPYCESLRWNSDLFLHVKIATIAGVYYIPETSGYFNKNYSSYGNKKNYIQQAETLDTLFTLLNEPGNKMVRQVYQRSGTLGKEPYSLVYLLKNRLYEFINLQFLIKSVLFKSRRYVFTHVRKWRKNYD